MESKVDAVRGLPGVLVLVAAVAGCIEVAPSEDILVEAFEATYTVESWYNLPARTVTVTLDGSQPFVGADGRLRTGYVVNVDEGEATISLSRPQDVLDENLSPVRQRWCNGWSGDERPPRCVTDQYDWDRDMGNGPLIPHYGIATIVGIGERAWVVQDGSRTVATTPYYAFHFEDNKLAPTQILLENKSYAVRTSYRSLGPLAAIANTEESPIFHPVSDQLLPGAEERFPGFNFSLAEAFDYLRSGEPRMQEFRHGCLVKLELRPSDSGGSQVGQLLADNALAHLTLAFSDGSSVGTFRVTYGKKAPLGNEEFLSSEEKPDPFNKPIDCQARGPDSLTIAQSISLSDVGPLSEAWYRDWEWRSQDGVLRLMGNAVFEGGSVQFDASRGRLVSAHVGPEVDLDG